MHAAASKRLFDEFLKDRSGDHGEPFVPFDINTDYRHSVDGRPRYNGVTTFLESCGIALPQETQLDGPDVQSVQALGNLKDKYFMEHLEQRGVEPHEAAIALVRALQEQQIKTAVGSSSNNCAKVLGIGENASAIRARICEGLGFLGLHLDEERNADGGPVISVDQSDFQMRVIHTDEDVIIAMAVFRMLAGTETCQNAQPKE